MRCATFGDYAQIAELQARHGIEAGSEAEWIYLWTGNPLYQELQKDWEIGWVVEDGEGRVVGSLGNLPLWYETAGKRIIAASGRALVTEPDYRSTALLLLDRLIHQPGVDLYLNNTVSAAAAPSFAGFECRRVPVGVWDRAAFWITNRPAFFAQFLHPRMGKAAKIASYPLSAADFLCEGLGRTLARPSDAEVTECAEFDEGFDRFWERLREWKREMLLAKRNRAMLNWHFRGALARGELWIARVWDGSAYGIFERKDNSKFGLSRMRLVDFQGIGDEAELLQATLGWALERCRAEGIDMLEVVGRWLEKGETVAAVAPHRRRLPNWTYFYRANRADLAQRLEDRSCWDPSLYDGDASL